jgi:predicted N-acetyltransferase YhbS
LIGLGLTFIGTDPLYERRGAASLLVRWGMKQCQIDHTPAYLESTVEAASFYEKHGFTAVETFSLDLKATGTDQFGIYEEISFLFNAIS